MNELGMRNSGLPTRIMMWIKAVTFLQWTRTMGRKRVLVFEAFKMFSFINFATATRDSDAIFSVFSCPQVTTNFDTAVGFSLQQLNRIFRWRECVKLSVGAVRRRADWDSSRLVLGKRSTQRGYLEDSEIQHSLHLERFDTAKCIRGNRKDWISTDTNYWSLVAGLKRSLSIGYQVHRGSEIKECFVLGSLLGWRLQGMF